MAASSDVLRRPARPQRGLSILVELLSRTEAVVRMPLRHELDRVRTIDMQTFALTIGTLLAADVDPFGPIEPHPSEIVDHRELRFARGALDVGVLDAHDERAALAACEQPVEECSAGVADVKLSGGTGSETKPHDRQCRPGLALDPATEQSDRMHRDRFAGAHRIDAFVRLLLHADLRAVGAERLPEVRAN